ncbi:FtsX-like permease family protein [Streptomyces sp. NPDC058674]|uniref:FtsX-like permease family protein n=1 Tax=Streptomyces sp. NPDC058674 TaxID=3346592 RepID=UPI00364AF5AB
MFGFVVRRLRGRLPLAGAVLLTVLITTTVLTALFAFTRGVGEAGLRQALRGPGHDRTTVVVTSEHPAASRGADDRAVRGFSDELFGPLPVRTESLGRSRPYGLPGAASPGKQTDLTVLASLDRQRARLLAGRWPEAAAASGRIEVAVPRAALVRLALTEAALPAELRLTDRYGDGTLAVQVTGVYRAADPGAPYWRLDPLGGREVQVGSFTTYGPLLVGDSAFTSGALAQDGRSWLLDPDFSGVGPAEAEAVRGRAAGLGSGPGAAEPARTGPKAPAGFQVRTELPHVLEELRSGQVVARSSLLVGTLQLTVLAGAVLLLVSRLLTDRQEPERVLLTARGSSRLRLGALGAAESLLLALPAAVLAPLLAPPLLRLLTRFGPLSRVPLDTSGTRLLWPVAAGCVLACVLLTALPAVLRGAGAAALRRSGRRQVLVAGTARSGADLALVVLAVLSYRQLARYGGGDGATPGVQDPSGLGIDPVLVAAPTLALCAGTLLVLRLLPLAARLGGRIAARGSGLGPALVGWQLARRPKRATGPVLLLVLAVSSGVLALGQHSAWSASQRDQADFATAGGLRISDSDLSPLGRGGRYAALPGGDRVIPVVRGTQDLPAGRSAQVLALDAAAVADRVPLRADLRDGRPMRELFAPLASGGAVGGNTLELPGRPRRIDVDVTVGAAPGTSRPGLALLLRDRFGLTFRTPVLPLPESGPGTVSLDLDALAGAPLGAAAEPLALAGLVASYEVERRTYGADGAPAASGSDFGELTVRRIAVADGPGGPSTTVPGPDPTAGWTLKAATPLKGAVVAELPPAAGGGPADGALLRVRYRAGPQTAGGVRIGLVPGAAPASEVPGVATRAYLRAVGAKEGDVVSVPLGSARVPVRIGAAVGSLPVAGDTAVAVDLHAVAGLLAADGVQEVPAAAEWWLPARSASDPLPARAAAELRAGAGAQRVDLREEVAAALLDDPLSAGPQAALTALAVACAILAAIGFGASSAASGRERSREFAVLLALGTPRGKLTRTTAAESGLLVGLATTVGIALGAAIVHLVVPLVVLTAAARPPVPRVLVDLPGVPTVLLAAAIAVVPLLSAVLGGRHDREVAVRLRHVEEM